MITVTRSPSAYDKYKHGANDSNGKNRQKNMDAAKSAYNKLKIKSLKKNMTALVSPLKN